MKQKQELMLVIKNHKEKIKEISKEIKDIYNNKEYFDYHKYNSLFDKREIERAKVSTLEWVLK